MNGGVWGIQDVDVFWTNSLARGDLDEVLRRLVVSGDVSWVHGGLLPECHVCDGLKDRSAYDSCSGFGLLESLVSIEEESDTDRDDPVNDVAEVDLVEAPVAQKDSLSGSSTFTQLNNRWRVLLSSVSDN